MTCPSCGEPAPEGAPVCPRCGYRFAGPLQDLPPSRESSYDRDPSSVRLEPPKFCPHCNAALGKNQSPCPSCLREVPLLPASSETYGPEPPRRQGQPLTAPTCPRCGFRLLGPAPYCPNCGTALNTGGVWPPPPAGYNPGPIPYPPSAGDQAGGFAAGCLLTAFLGPLYGIGLIASGLIYFLTRRKQPRFARGLGFGMAVGIAIVLGLIAICYPMMKGL